MIRAGDKVLLLKNKEYKDDPSKNEDVGYGDNKFGNFQQFQVYDSNVTKNKGMFLGGFFYMQIFSNDVLAPNDVVIIKEILYVQRKRNVCIFGVKLKEVFKGSVDDHIKEEEKEFEY